MAPPDDARTRTSEDARQASRLGIVEQHDVSAADERQELVRVLVQHPLIVATLGFSEWATITGPPVEPVVNPLGDLKEGVVALDHEPSRVDAGSTHVGEQRDQHLRDPSAGRR